MPCSFIVVSEFLCLALVQGQYDQYMKQYVPQAYQQYVHSDQSEKTASDDKPVNFMERTPDSSDNQPSQPQSDDSGGYQKYYQHYMQQYAGAYQKYAGGQGGSQGGQSGDYQKYMKQYARGGGSQGGNWQHYMKKYAGAYQKYAGSQGGSQGGQSGEYQQYMKQYAEGGASNSTEGSQNSATELLEKPTDHGSSMELWWNPLKKDDHKNEENGGKSQAKQTEGYVKEYVPEAFHKKAMKEEHLTKGDAPHIQDTSIDLMSESQREQMKGYVKEFVPDEDQNKAMREEHLTKDGPKFRTFLASKAELNDSTSAASNTTGTNSTQSLAAAIDGPLSLALAGLAGVVCFVIAMALILKTRRRGQKVEAVAFPDCTLG